TERNDGACEVSLEWLELARLPASHTQRSPRQPAHTLAVGEVIEGARAQGVSAAEPAIAFASAAQSAAGGALSGRLRACAISFFA
ncbi:hypothetical protein C1X31_34260, partial [Pseudomonas sp. GW456-11-11-14-LB2]